MEAIQFLYQSSGWSGPSSYTIYGLYNSDPNGGHQRLTAADTIYQSNDYDVPVAIIDVDTKTEKKLNVQLNNPSLQGSWNLDELLKLSDDVSFEEMGFDQSDIDNMFDGQVAFSSDDDPDDLSDPLTGNADDSDSSFEPSFQNAQKALFEFADNFTYQQVKFHCNPVVDLHVYA
ncbi:hypothetical protein FC52_GL000614 [Lactobacillus pasteurii DSM 23907 = CRBIP 24.76]|uniref:ParB-like protein n=1 Tax=Lactobacillus pasteurii DSM 23907 = CRBIP 24.76 TaxID=1423790 RepID=I7KL49_9LACO|nr:hypothetical protein [Lactobacillus pasteurii]KRK07444.1 hypothetical protein FC52_GL000614 [Lactobacillus pasteurii DSM 23907 = CRBIP 24.76]TDG76690.1 hypothetical protein C5L33_000251 [Lactobacillus pasteurii]CCI85074.1 ParB-like protein [Lactobacillus pasteurii DSM 23907 = CRBIP 24.76]